MSLKKDLAELDAALMQLPLDTQEKLLRAIQEIAGVAGQFNADVPADVATRITKAARSLAISVALRLASPFGGDPFRKLLETVAPLLPNLSAVKTIMAAAYGKLPALPAQAARPALPAPEGAQPVDVHETPTVDVTGK